jgi:hypothetical protein
MTTEEIQQKADELSVKHSCRVHPLIFKDAESNEEVIGYLKEPPRHVKLRVMDKGLTAPATAAAEVVDAFLIREESDSRLYDENPTNDKYYLGATMEAYNLISMAINQFKKK